MCEIVVEMSDDVEEVVEREEEAVDAETKKQREAMGKLSDTGSDRTVTIDQAATKALQGGKTKISEKEQERRKALAAVNVRLPPLSDPCPHRLPFASFRSELRSEMVVKCLIGETRGHSAHYGGA